MLEIKKFTEQELKSILENATKKATEQATFEYNLRKEFSKNLEKQIQEIEKKSNYDYIISLKEINLFSLRNENYFQERKLMLLEKFLQKYFYYDISTYNLNFFVKTMLSQYKYIEFKNKSLKFNINILDKWNDININNLYNFFKFFKTITEIDIPNWNYDFYKSFQEFNEKYILNDKISFKIYKNGKIEVYFN